MYIMTVKCPCRVTHSMTLIFFLIIILIIIMRVYRYVCVKAKEFGRKAVSMSASTQDEQLSRKLVDFLKVCENIDTDSM